jgi:hypothetical protein
MEHSIRVCLQKPIIYNEIRTAIRENIGTRAPPMTNARRNQRGCQCRARISALFLPRTRPSRIRLISIFPFAFLVSASDFLPVSLRVSGVCGFTAFVDPPLPFSTAPVDGSPFGSGTPDRSRSDFEPTLRLIYVWVGLFPCFYPKFGKTPFHRSSTLPEK